MDLFDRLYPERRIAGFSRNDQRIAYFNQINAILEPDMRVLDFGAGRGKWADMEKGYKLELTTLRGKCKEVVGTDVDPEVLNNPLLDTATVTPFNERLPFEDNSFDLVTSWAVFEHVANPEFTAAELTRVIKPGGWLCAWTPSKWSYIALGARAIPNRFHAAVVRWMGTTRKDEDIFPTVYKLNTRRALRKHFPAFEDYSYYFNGPPSYHAGSRLLATAWLAWARIMPPICAQQLHIFLQKK